MAATRDERPKADSAGEFSPPLFPQFELAPGKKRRLYKRVNQPIWTENKAHFIQQYLRFFVQVTKHGNYIDGFAGPQYSDRLDAWCARLVVESEPKWLRQFFLCEITRRGIRSLEKLKKSQPVARDKAGRKIRRTIEVIPGDFNVKVDGILECGKIAQNEATFCLLDQRTFECHWRTVEKLARYKKPPHNKIEVLYFLGVGWLGRALSGIRDTEKMLEWWGRSDWQVLKGMQAADVAELVRKRFVTELGYKSAAAYPIFDRAKGNRVMYYMIHASDHEEAPALMVRAHHKAVRARSTHVQGQLPFPEKP